MDPIEIGKLSDRELLVLTATKVNELAKVEARVSSLENWRNWISGGLAAIAGLLGLHMIGHPGAGH